MGDYQTTSRWLERALKLHTETQHLRREIRRLELEATSIVTPPGNGGRSSLPADKVGRAAARIADETAKLAAMLAEIRQRKHEIRETIMRYTETPRHEEVLLRRYVEFQRWEDIAEAMTYEDKYVYRLRREAVEQIAEHLQEEGPWEKISHMN